MKDGPNICVCVWLMQCVCIQPVMVDNTVTGDYTAANVAVHGTYGQYTLCITSVGRVRLFSRYNIINIY